MDVATETGTNRKPRVVIIFDTSDEYDSMRDYARDKGLDMKNFFMWLAKSHMKQYPSKTAQKQDGV